jgi:hypothetical protein
MVSPVSALKAHNSIVVGSKSSQSAELMRLRETLFYKVNKQDLMSVYNIPKIKIKKTLDLSKKNSNHTYLAIKEDFELHKICIIDGWVLSQTEVILCLMT